MLKKKSKLNYRRGHTWKNCGTCDHFRPNAELTGIGGKAMAPADRCTVIGLDAGRMYQIHRKNICDRHHDSKTEKNAAEFAARSQQREAAQ